MNTTEILKVQNSCLAGHLLMACVSQLLFFIFCRFNYSRKVKKIVVIFLSLYFCYSQVPTNIDSVVYFQMLLLRSKMDIDPIVWQDTREGYLRNSTMKICDRTLDKLVE